jgi:two-component system, response regulator
MGGADILLVEDNRYDVEIILDVTNEMHFMDRIHVLRNGAEALDYFFSTEGCLQSTGVRLPKVILLDLKLPKISGLEFLKHIKADERTKHIPVVIFTSSNELQDRLESYRLGVNSYVVKPLDADVFSRFVADTLSYWVSMNRIIHET